MYPFELMMDLKIGLKRLELSSFFWNCLFDIGIVEKIQNHGFYSLFSSYVEVAFSYMKLSDMLIFLRSS